MGQEPDRDSAWSWKVGRRESAPETAAQERVVGDTCTMVGGGGDGVYFRLTPGTLGPERWVKSPHIYTMGLPVAAQHTELNP